MAGLRAGVLGSDSAGRPGHDEHTSDALGVVFVHGIGTKRRGETLAEWSDPILEWIDRRHGGDIELLTGSAGGREPAHTRVSLNAEGERQTWLLAEAHWAEAFAEPTFRELWSWGIPTIPAVLASHLGGTRFRIEYDRLSSSRLRRAVRHARVAGLALSAFLLLAVLAPLLVLTMTLLLVVGAVPYRRLRAWVAAMQRTLVLSVGDSRALLRSHTLRASLMGIVQEAVEFVGRTSQSVVVVAHSQGAAIAHMALASTENQRDNYLVTVGSGLNKLEYLRQATEPDEAVQRLALRRHWGRFLLFSRPLSQAWLSPLPRGSSRWVFLRGLWSSRSLRVSRSGLAARAPRASSG